MYWDNDLEARPKDRIETEPPKEQPLPLTQEELPAENEDAHQNTISFTDVADNTIPEQPEDKEYVDADADCRSSTRTPRTKTPFYDMTRSP